MKLIKTTVIGGALFLVPVVVVILVVNEAIDIMKTVAEPLAEVLPIDSIGGVAVANVLAVAAVILLCFVAGLISQTKPAKAMAESIENSLLNWIPGYTMFRGMTGVLSKDASRQLDPVMVQHLGVQRIGLQVEPVDDERVAVYFPNAPNVWSGVVEIVPVSSIEHIDASMMDVIENIEKLGRGSQQVMSSGSGN